MQQRHFTTYLTQHYELFDGFLVQIEAELCDCRRAPFPLLIPIIEKEEGYYVFSRHVGVVFSGHVKVVFNGHPEDCNLSQTSRDIEKTWGSYIRRKTKEFREAQLNR